MTGLTIKREQIGINWAVSLGSVIWKPCQFSGIRDYHQRCWIKFTEVCTCAHTVLQHDVRCPHHFWRKSNGLHPIKLWWVPCESTVIPLKRVPHHAGENLILFCKAYNVVQFERCIHNDSIFSIPGNDCWIIGFTDDCFMNIIELG